MIQEREEIGQVMVNKGDSAKVEPEQEVACAKMGTETAKISFSTNDFIYAFFFIFFMYAKHIQPLM